MLRKLAAMAENLDFFMNSSAWRDDGMLKLYLYCAAKASRNVYEWHGIVLQPGDLPLSERKAAASLGWSRNKLDRKLKLLNESGLISITSIQQKGTIVHVQNWPQNETIGDHDRDLSWYQIGATPQQDGLDVEPQRFQNEAAFRQNWTHDDAKTSETGSMMRHNIYINNNSNLIGNILEPDGFAKIWFAYPANRRNQREQASALVSKAFSEGATLESMLEALEADKRSTQWLADDGKYIPGIVKWLQKETWHDYLRTEPPKEDEEHWVSR